MESNSNIEKDTNENSLNQGNSMQHIGERLSTDKLESQMNDLEKYCESRKQPMNMTSNFKSDQMGDDPVGVNQTSSMNATKLNQLKMLPLKQERYSYNRRTDIKEKVLFQRTHYIECANKFITATNIGEFMYCDGNTLSFDQGVRSHECGFKAMKIIGGPEAQTMVTGDDNGHIHWWRIHSDVVYKEKHELAKMITHLSTISHCHSEAVNDLAFSQNQRKFASCSDDTSIGVYDVERCCQEGKMEGQGHNISSVDWHPDKALIASSAKNGTVALWDPRQRSQQVQWHAHHDAANGVLFSRDGNSMFTCGKDAKVKIQDLRTLNEKRELKRHKRSVTGLRHVDDNILASFSQDGSVLFWDTSSEQENILIHPLVAHENAILDAYICTVNNKMLMATTSTDNSMRFWTPPKTDQDIHNLNQKACLEEKSTFEGGYKLAEFLSKNN